MNILVVGTGNIASTLINLLLEYRDLLGIGTLWVLKNRLQPWQLPDLDILRERGAVLCSRERIAGMTLLSEIESHVDYVFDCAENGTALSLKHYYERLPRLIGACAQGSEKGFGIPFMTGINTAAVRGARFVQIVSCNTHGTAAVLKTFAGENLERLIEGDTVVVRRCEDIGAHQRLVAASVVARHLDPVIGTHHAIDVIDLWKTVGIAPNISSSDVTTPSQLMHAARFHLILDHETSGEEIKDRIAANPLVGTTGKFDSNSVFELGRRYGFQGRIFEHAIVVDGNLLVEGNRIRGWIFVPQEGNTVLSTLDAFLLQVGFPERDQVLAVIQQRLLRGRW